MTSVNALAILLEAVFANRQIRMHCFTPVAHAHMG